jgi:Ca2+-binding RTX toxin-like protein
VADGADGYDYIEIGSGIQAPVTLSGGSQKDWLLYYGAGDAVISGGMDDDEIQGGTGANTFVFSDAYGRDKLTSLSAQNNFDFSPVTEDLTGSLTADQFIMTPSGYNRLVSARVRVNDRDAIVVPDLNFRNTVVLQSHGLSAGSGSGLCHPTGPNLIRNSPLFQRPPIPS